MKRLAAFIWLFLLLPQTASCQVLQERFHRLVDTQGVSGYETDVRELVRAQFPAWARSQVDTIGNLSVSFGHGAPHTMLIAALDENGYVVSRITDDGYLRLHRHGSASNNILRDQFMVGQPVLVRGASGRLISGVTATPSLHLRRLLNPAEVARIRDIGDLWVDVGAANAAAVAQLGIRVLDPVNLRERAQSLANGRVAGVNTQLRAGAQALVELLRAMPGEPTPTGTITLVWTVQSQFNERGLARLAQAVHPARAFVIGAAVTAPKAAPAEWSDVPIVWKSVPALFESTTVEVVDVAQITALTRELAAETGLTMGDGSADVKPLPAPPPRIGQNASGPFAILKPLIETYGVSGHEAPVREVVRKLLPPWAQPVEDEQGNLSLSFGQGGKELLFIAHLDETGFEVTGLRADGMAAIRDQGGMYLSLYEAQPVWVHTAKGKVPAVIAPRPHYATATGAQPDMANLLLYFGTDSAAETQALGVAAGQAASVRKQFVELAAPRATGRSMDDRAGITALLMALKMVDPATLKNRITVAFSVGEENGYSGARAMAKRLHPQYAFAIDTFVSTDTPNDPQYLAHAPLGHGPVLRGMDNLILTPAATIDRITQLAQTAKIPLQIGVTQGGVDSFAFSAGGAIDVGLSWPGRYSHSSVEIIDQRDLVKLSELIALLMRQL
ncbi:M20/M25/M40 family metallo-hydrolase [Rugamonas sp.]|uniref:M20/M25/M40 family metallo-hydrolase n=1 Tax=Rugamonas sp. TaxID=1926287 RepID=UPI0025D2FDA0|nr:M20/M25/M40 family metallo-hydrolase [Rugamonas sp.]